MLTRCPRCETTFRVTPEQLKARQGRVRCGECQNIFNALDTLVEEIPLVPIVAAPEPALRTAMGPPAATAEPAAAEATPIAPAPEAVEVVPEPLRAETATPSLADPEAVAAPTAPSEPGPHPESDARSDSESVADSAASEPKAKTEPKLEPLLHEAVPKRTWPWALGVGAALFVLAAQTAMHFRTEIAVLHPEARPLLAAACAAFGCELTLPRKPELVGIEASDLHPEADGKLMLSATLKNRAPFAQEYPHLELTLTDTADRPLVRRVLAPAGYLAPKTPVAAGFGANAEVAINLAVEAPGIPAAGYRLYIFYP